MKKKVVSLSRYKSEKKKEQDTLPVMNSLSYHRVNSIFSDIVRDLLQLNGNYR